MGKFRFTTHGLFGFIFVTGVCFASLAKASPPVFLILLIAALMALATMSIGTFLYRQPAHRECCAAFVLIGSGLLLLGYPLVSGVLGDSHWLEKICRDAWPPGDLPIRWSADAFVCVLYLWLAMFLGFAAGVIVREADGDRPT